MTRRFALGFLVAAAVGANAAAAQTAAGDRPNVVVIVADDLGYGGVSCYGGDLKTPKIDTLASSGIRFTNGYVSCPVCSPTRAGLNTGRYQQRFGHEFNPGPEGNASGSFGLPLSEATIADRMKAAGYTTGLVGKWHLGHTPERMPPRRGFDEFFGFAGGAHSYLDPKFGSQNSIMRGEKPVDEKRYLTTAFTEEAVAFIDRHAREAKPFCLLVTYNAVHVPMDTTPEYLNRFGHIPDLKRRRHAAMLAAMDDGVGAINAALRKHELEGRTLVFFFSDNGGPTPGNTSSNKPLRGYKGQVLEGGIRVPFMVSWPGQIPAGKVDDRPVIQLDVTPTALAVAGGTPAPDKPLDGVNLMPYLTGKQSGQPHEALFWRMGDQAAVRIGDWKLIRVKGGGDAKPQQYRRPTATSPAGAKGVAGVGSAGVQLYDLARDIHEDRDLAAQKPDKVKELTAALDRWEGQMGKPLWEGRGKPRKAKAAAASGSGERRPGSGRPAGQRRGRAPAAGE